MKRGHQIISRIISASCISGTPHKTDRVETRHGGSGAAYPAPSFVGTLFAALLQQAQSLRTFQYDIEENQFQLALATTAASFTTASSTTILKELKTFLFGSEISRRSTYFAAFNRSDLAFVEIYGTICGQN